MKIKSLGIKKKLDKKAQQIKMKNFQQKRKNRKKSKNRTQK